MSQRAGAAAKKIAASARLMVRVGAASRPRGECRIQILSRGPKRSLAPTLSVAVAPERRARRGHGGCVCSRGERWDRDQRDQREGGDEFPHDTSPCLTLSCFRQRRYGGVAGLAFTTACTS